MFLIISYVISAVVITYMHMDALRKDMSTLKNPIFRYLSFYICFLISPIAFVLGYLYALLGGRIDE